MKKDDYIKIVAVDGNYRYGYIEKIEERGSILVISMFDEGISKIAYDAAADAIVGQEPTDYISLLTKAEKHIVSLLSAGYNSKDIAAALSISPTTVRAHLRTLRIKLHLDDRAQLIAFSRGLDSMIRKQAEVDEGIQN
ncbi:hypothetical protein ES703_84111 [subsurface metagenome]